MRGETSFGKVAERLVKQKAIRLRGNINYNICGLVYQKQDG